ATDEKRAARLQRPLVGRVELDAREAHADDDVLPHADAAIDRDLIALGDAVAKHVEDVAAIGNRRDLADADPLHLRVEHPLDRVEVAGDDGAVAPEQEIDRRLTHLLTRSQQPGFDLVADVSSAANDVDGPIGFMTRAS